jgi:hypothetical protein
MHASNKSRAERAENQGRTDETIPAAPHQEGFRTTIFSALSPS